jgi:hypothetical protein
MDRHLSARLTVALAVVIALRAGPAGAGECHVAVEAKTFVLSPEVIADEHEGGLRLAHSVLVADEMGATDFRQTEELSERVHARKVFHLDSADVTGAELFFYGSAKQVHVNGKSAAGVEPLMSTGFSRVKVSPAQLRPGDNEVIFSGGGSLLVEPCRQPGRSFKSGDGGRTWSADTLGRQNDQRGEYLVRLRLGRYAPHGWALTPVLDLWAADPARVPTPGKVEVHPLAGLGHDRPAGTRLGVSLRTGSTPVPDTKTWTDWVVLDRDYHPPAAAERHRWAQLRLDLATNQAQATPRVPPRLDIAFTVQDEPAAGRYVVEEQSPAEPRGSVPFVYQEPSPRLQLLRERYHLDDVIAPGRTEMERLMLLRYWVRNQWHTAWGSHPAAWMPPWDALVILEAKDQPDCLTMCTHYACVFTQCCLALGWNARHCILDHHCVAEVWLGQHHKWVMMDAGNSAERADVGLHFERHGVPQSARELHLAQRTGKTDGLDVCFTPARLAEKIALLCRAAPKPAVPRPDSVPVSELRRFPVCQLDTYRRYAFPARNNYLTSLVPGELYEGWSHYFYDGYWWVGDSPDEPRLSPEYSRHLPPERGQDVDWPLDWSHLHLCRTVTAGELQVDVETMTPNLGRLERWTNGNGGAGSWQATAASFRWRLRPGENVLRVRGVNRWDRAGSEAKVRVRWEPERD